MEFHLSAENVCVRYNHRKWSQARTIPKAVMSECNARVLYKNAATFSKEVKWSNRKQYAMLCINCQSSRNKFQINCTTNSLCRCCETYTQQQKKEKQKHAELVSLSVGRLFGPNCIYIFRASNLMKYNLRWIPSLCLLRNLFCFAIVVFSAAQNYFAKMLKKLKYKEILI